MAPSSSSSSIREATAAAALGWRRSRCCLHLWWWLILLIFLIIYFCVRFRGVLEMSFREPRPADSFLYWLSLITLQYIWTSFFCTLKRENNYNQSQPWKLVYKLPFCASTATPSDSVSNGKSTSLPLSPSERQAKTDGLAFSIWRSEIGYPSNKHGQTRRWCWPSCSLRFARMSFFPSRRV